MAEFYLFPELVRLSISLGALACVIVQALLLLHTRWLFKKDHLLSAETLQEILLLLHLAICFLLINELQVQIASLIIVPGGYIALRYALFAFFFGQALYLSIVRKTFWPVVNIPALALTLPILENLPWLPFRYAYLFSLLFFLLRACCLLHRRRADLRTSLSALSVKDAIDTLHTGLAFCERDGRILLINKRMQKLLVSLTGMHYYSGKIYPSDLLSGENITAAEKKELGQQVLYCLPDQRAWLFSEQALHIRRHHYRQFTASDVSERWQMTLELGRQSEQLETRRSELRETLLNLEKICYEEELIRARSGVHNLMGQRISLFLSSLRKGEAADAECLRPLAGDLPECLYQEKYVSSMKEELEKLTELFAGIGVTLHISSTLSEVKKHRELLLEIISEAVNNALRHAYASEVDIQLEQDGERCCLTIEDNGMPPVTALVEGGGITAMREKLLAVKGKLEIMEQPHVRLVASFPLEAD